MDYFNKIAMDEIAHQKLTSQSTESKEALIKSEISCDAERMVSWKKTRGGARKWDS